MFLSVFPITSLLLNKQSEKKSGWSNNLTITMPQLCVFQSEFLWMVLWLSSQMIAWLSVVDSVLALALQCTACALQETLCAPLTIHLG